MKLHAKIDRIIESPYLSYWVFCGKESQKEVRRKNKYCTDEEREELLPWVVEHYLECLNSAKVGDKEKRNKSKRVIRFANK